MQYFCCDEPRRGAVRGLPNINGIDYVEVGDPPAAPGQPVVLSVYLLNQIGNLFPTPPSPLTPAAYVRIEGGDRIRAAAPSGDVTAPPPPPSPGGVLGLLGRLFRQPNTEAAVVDPDPSGAAAAYGTLAVTGLSWSATTSRLLQVQLNGWGDASRYTLRLVKPGGDPSPPPEPLDGLDPLLSAVDFSFTSDTPGAFDCAPVNVCPPDALDEPEIDYLAKDYASLRQLLLDRVAAIAPQWQERNAADLGIALLEVLAYVGDHLSYRQDAIATEAYLGTARRRISIRRHARLVDYYMHDGCNARAWVQLELAVTGANTTVPVGTQLLTRLSGMPALIAPASSAYNTALAQAPEVFETMRSAPRTVNGVNTYDLACFPEHNRISFYTWGARECCLPSGATEATLFGPYPNLRAGDVLIFVEALGPGTGQPEDADPTHRWAVRLTAVDATKSDPIGRQFPQYANTPGSGPLPVTAIAWSADDALPLALTLSATTDQAHGSQWTQNISIALGNIVLADNGRTLPAEPLGTVPQPVPVALRATGGLCVPGTPQSVLPPFRPTLQQAPLTQVAPYDPTAPAAGAFVWQMSAVLPDITTADDGGNTWNAQYDLLDSHPSDREFVAEVNDQGAATLRFGDGTYGQRPAVGARFTATYRAGNGTRGNVGAQTLLHVVSANTAIIRVWNPMAARGGVDPESIEHVRQSAPSAFLTQERAVTPADYVDIAQRNPLVLRAQATFRWTGSWRTVFVTVERPGGLLVDEPFKEQLLAYLEPYRMAGHDVEVEAPIYVPLELDMTVSVKPQYFRNDVRAALMAIFTSGLTPNGRRGIFYPDNFTFGQTVYLSPFYAAAQAVAGVAALQVTVFQRRDAPSQQPIMDGKIDFARFEIPRLDNNPDYPERGVFVLTLEGGK